MVAKPEPVVLERFGILGRSRILPAEAELNEYYPDGTEFYFVGWRGDQEYRIPVDKEFFLAVANIFAQRNTDQAELDAFRAAAAATPPEMQKKGPDGQG